MPTRPSAVLLAAGESRRMGQLKALLDWKGSPLIIHQVRTLWQAGADDIVIVLGHRAQELQTVLATEAPPETNLTLRWVVNENYRSGKLGSMKAGLQEVQGFQASGPALLLNVDQPRSALTIRLVLEAHELGVRRKGILFTIPTYEGRGGHPIVLERELIQEVLELSEESKGLRTVRDRDWDRVQRVELGKAELLWDVNTPEEFQEVIEELKNI